MMSGIGHQLLAQLRPHACHIQIWSIRNYGDHICRQKGNHIRSWNKQQGRCIQHGMMSGIEGQLQPLAQLQPHACHKLHENRCCRDIRSYERHRSHRWMGNIQQHIHHTLHTQSMALAQQWQQRPSMPGQKDLF